MATERERNGETGVEQEMLPFSVGIRSRITKPIASKKRHDLGNKGYGKIDPRKAFFFVTPI